MKVKYKIFIIIYCIIVYLIAFAFGFLSYRAVYKDKYNDTISLTALDDIDDLIDLNVPNTDFTFIEQVYNFTFDTTIYGNSYEIMSGFSVISGYYALSIHNLQGFDVTSNAYVTFYDFLGYSTSDIVIGLDYDTSRYLLVNVPSLSVQYASGSIYCDIYANDFVSFDITVYHIKSFEEFYNLGFTRGFIETGNQVVILREQLEALQSEYDNYVDNVVPDLLSNAETNGYNRGYSAKGLFHNIIDSLSSIFEIRIGGEHGLSLGGLCLIAVSTVAFFVLIKMFK